MSRGSNLELKARLMMKKVKRSNMRSFQNQPYNKLLTAVAKFVGQIRQLTPRYSAVKIQGKRAYKIARAGKSFPLPPRDVEIKSIEIIGYQWPFLDLKVVCGPGVYIRSLARDIGDELTTKAYLSKLVRTRVGIYCIEDSINFK